MASELENERKCKGEDDENNSNIRYTVFGKGVWSP
jgi:hypothetical protein